MRILYLIPLTLLVFYWRGQTFNIGPSDGIKKSTPSNVVITPIQANTLLFMCDRVSDSLELVKFYNATDGANWWKKWDLTKPMDFWFGIGLNSEGCVSGIYLGDTFNVSGYSGNNLKGLFVPLNLPSLKDLYLLNNKLTGNLSSFENLRSLELLNIYGNQFNGSIPNFDFQSLKSLVIASNKLSGGIPQFNKLPKLEYLGIAIMDSISGPLLDFDLPMLKGLELHQLSITGDIPNFTKMPSLEWFQIYDTKQISIIPNFSYLPKLKSLLIGAQLYGQIPDFNKMPKLESLQLGGTNHTPKDPIPDFTNLPELKYLSLGDMDLTGSIPEFKKCPLLEDIRVRINNLSGNIPDYYKTHPNLNSLNIDNNKFTFQNIIYNLSKNRAVVDSILYAPQKCIYADTTISVSTASNYTLDLKIDDTVTTSTYTWSKNGVFYKTIKGINKLTFLPFTSNDAGTYTVKITNPLAPQLTLESCPIRLNSKPMVVCDRRSDSLELVKFYIATDTAKWIIKWNLSKPLDSWFGISLTSEGCVEVIELGSRPGGSGGGNNVSSKQLPLVILPFLKSLSLHANMVEGKIPDWNLPSIENLNFQSNLLSGPLPDFSKMPKLKFLNLFQNSTVGDLSNLKNLFFLEKVVLWHNNLSGAIPDLDLPKLKYLDISGNSWVGTIPDFQHLPDLEELYLYNGQLTGPLPNFSKIKKLKSLQLYNQKLTNSIPDFSNLPDLESLSLSSNLFIGNIPALLKSPNLNGINCGYNFLTGKIPDYYKTHPKLTWGSFEVNHLTFSGIISNLKENKKLIDIPRCPTCIDDTMVYAQQRNIYIDTTISIQLNSNYILDLLIDDTVTTSTYAWYKNGVLDTIIKGKNKLPFAPFTSNDAGTYTVKITNPHAPQLTLESWQIRLTTSCVQPSFTTPNFSALSCKSSGHMLPEISNIFTGNARYFTQPNRQGTSYAVGTILYDSILLYANDFNSCSPNTTQIEKTYLVRISERPKVSISISRQPSCINSKDGRLAPDFAKISGIGPFSFTWLGEGIRTGISFTGVGIKPSSLVITDSRGCTDTATITLKPVIDNNIILKSDQQTVKNKTPQLFDVLTNDNIPAGIVVNVTIDNAQNGIMIYSLTTGRGTYTPNTGFSGKEKLNYKVCPVACPTECLSSTIEFEVETPCADKTNLVLPNVIFPDGPTGANRYFFVEALEKCKEAFGPRPTKLSVYNRWGDLVFYSKDYLNNWEGTNTQGQPLPAGTYYYLLDLGSQAAPVKGYVVIMR